MRGLQLILLVFGIAVAYGSSLPQTPAKADNWLIVSGQGFGPVRSNSSEAELRRIFGNKNVHATQVHVGEGETESGTVLFPGNSEKRVEIIWKDPAQRRNPDWVILTGARSLWRTAEGISLGTSLKELEQINGGPFLLSGFDWDYEGTVLSWEKGRLESLKRNPGIGVRLAPPRDAGVVAALGLSDKDWEAVGGDREFRSDSHLMQRINPRIYQISMKFD